MAGFEESDCLECTRVPQKGMRDELLYCYVIGQKISSILQVLQDYSGSTKFFQSGESYRVIKLESQLKIRY